ncbi:efflux RND transporter periplasmic adaptor subunit [Luteimonas sp. RIT-PG2_3]
MNTHAIHRPHGRLVHSPSCSSSSIRMQVLLSSMVLAGLLAACSRAPAEQHDEALPEVRTAQAKAAGDAFELRLPARALPGESVRLYARTTGFISERRVDIGDRVEAGQVLAVISAPETDQSVRELEADATQARAELELARGNHERASTLVASNLISRETFSDRVAARDAAQAALGAAQARLASARDRKGFAVVRAPFAGVISARNIERGDRVVGDSASAAEPMFELNALDPLRIVVDVPQSAAMQVQPGLRAQVGFAEIPDQSFEAEVVRSARSISGDAGGMRVELQLPNPGERIPAGMVGEVRLDVPRGAAVVTVPISAVLQGAEGARVMRLGAGTVVEYLPVRLGRNLGQEMEILGGLSAGETVVLAPNALLASGSKVRLAPEKKPAGA